MSQSPNSASPSASDQFNATNSAYVFVFQSAGLIRTAAKMAGLANQSQDQQDEADFALATLLAATTAVEALLSEVAFTLKPTLYNHKNSTGKFDYKRAKIGEKYKLLTGNTLSTDYPDIDMAYKHRNRIIHSEPDNPLSTKYGEIINKASAKSIVQTVLTFAHDLWGNQMPDWFKADTQGL